MNSDSMVVQLGDKIDVGRVTVLRIAQEALNNSLKPWVKQMIRSIGNRLLRLSLKRSTLNYLTRHSVCIRTDIWMVDLMI